MPNILHKSHGHGDGSTLDSSSRTNDMAYMSRSQDLAGIDTAASLLPSHFPSDQPVFGTYHHHVPATSNALEQWYTRNDGPWIPKDIAVPGAPNGINQRTHPFAFSGPYRESISPSECDTIPPGLMPSDSGYGSHRAKQSIATASVHYDDTLDSQETQSLVGNFAFGMDPSQWSQPQGQGPASVVQRPHADGKELICETCQKPLKTNSELKKHQQRHTKPHVCDVVGCNRVDGFSTSNDLDRHKRSVHPTEFANGNRFRCTLGACRNKEKIWPRADNFRAHIKRVHRQLINDDDLEKFIYRTIAQQDLPDLTGMQPPSVEYNFQLSPNIQQNQFATPYWGHDVASSRTSDTNANHQVPGSQVGRDQQTTEQIHRPTASGSQANTSYSHDQSGTNTADTVKGPTPSSAPVADVSPCGGQQQFVTPGDLSHAIVPSLGSATDHSRAREDQQRQTKLSVSPDASSEGDESAESPGPDMMSTSPQPASVTVPTAEDVSSLVSDLKDPEKLKQVLEALQSQGLLEGLGYKKEESCLTEEKEPELKKQRTDSSNHCPNPTCRKTFLRRCELKKHMKRHDKPYGCTYEGCNKRFGSKNDWKRHENSQHFLLEVWKCDVKSLHSSSEVCGKVSHRRETFRQHLVSCHHLATDVLEHKLEECRVGRNCEANFWCGFCEEVIKIKSRGVSAWTERYNHIDDHLAGRNGLPRKVMDDWKNVDPDSNVRDDSSAAETDASDLPAPTTSPAKRRALSTSDTHKETAQPIGTKRKAGELGDSRHFKRMKAGYILTRCCECGEGNTRSGMNPQCVNLECQHTLCNNCT